MVALAVVSACRLPPPAPARPAEPPAAEEPPPLDEPEPEVAEAPVPAPLPHGLRPGETVVLGWRTLGPGTGELFTRLPNGRLYRGPFVLAEAGVAMRLPLSVVFSESAGMERSVLPLADGSALAAVPRIPTQVSGRVRDESGEELSCQLLLQHPRRGLGGGSSGWCRDRDGVRFPARTR